MERKFRNKTLSERGFQRDKEITSNATLLSVGLMAPLVARDRISGRKCRRADPQRDRWTSRWWPRRDSGARSRQRDSFSG